MSQPDCSHIQRAQTAPISSLHKPTLPDHQLIADPTSFFLWGLKFSSSSPLSFLQILVDVPSSTGLKSAFCFACYHRPSSSPYHLPPVPQLLLSSMPTLRIADRLLLKSTDQRMLLPGTTVWLHACILGEFANCLVKTISWVKMLFLKKQSQTYGKMQV